MQRGAIEALVLEQFHGRAQMLFCFPYPSSTSERVQQPLVHLLVIGRKLPPLLQALQRFLVRAHDGKPLEQLHVAIAEAVSLGGEPRVEVGAALELESLEEVPSEQRQQGAAALGVQFADTFVRKCRLQGLVIDVTALESTHDPDAFRAVQRRLALRSLADPTPSWFGYVWFASHPTVLQRLAIADAVEAGQEDGKGTVGE